MQAQSALEQSLPTLQTPVELWVSNVEFEPFAVVQVWSVCAGYGAVSCVGHPHRVCVPPAGLRTRRCPGAQPRFLIGHTLYPRLKSRGTSGLNPYKTQLPERANLGQTAPGSP